MKHGNTYEIGRDISDKSPEYFIHVQKLYISKTQLQINVIPTDIFETQEPSTLSVKVLTRASTTINGVKHKLTSSSLSPFTIQYHEDVSMSFKKEEERITIKWEPVSIYTVAEMDGLLGSLYDSGLDIRQAKVPDHANALLIDTEISPFAGSISMIYDLPIVTRDWIEYIKTASGSLLGNSDITVRYLFRENYAAKRSDIFQGFVFNSADFRGGVERVIRNNGGDFVKKAYDLLDSGRSNESFRDQYFNGEQMIIYHNKPSQKVKEFAEFYGTVVVNDEELYEMVKNEDSLRLKLRKRKAEESEVTSLSETQMPTQSQIQTETQTTQRRRKRHKRARDNLAFLFPTQSEEQDDGTQPSGQNKSQEPLKLQESQFKEPEESMEPDHKENTLPNESEKPKDVLLRAQVEQLSEPTTQLSSPQPMEENPITVPVEEAVKRAASSALERKTKRQKLTADEAFAPIDLEFNPEIVHSKKRTPKTEKVKEESTKDLDLFDAIRITKDKAGAKVKKELGLDNADIADEDSMELQLQGLAIVETVSMKLRKPNPKPADDMYKGRKNFKTFKKNMAVKPQVTRTFVKMKDPLNVMNASFFPTEETQESQDGTDSQILPTQDSQPIIPENDIFVSNEIEDDEPASLIPSKKSPRKNRKSSRTQEVENYIDDDEDEDSEVPRFAFS